MKKYRLTKITVKTREIISLSKNAANESEISICPVCHSPFSAMLPAAESSAAPAAQKRPAELPSAENVETRDKQLKN